MVCRAVDPRKTNDICKSFLFFGRILVGCLQPEQKLGGDEEDDPLLNPAHALVSTMADNKEMANKFVDWLISEDGGQEIARTFTKNGVILYSPAPPGKGP